LENSHAEAVQSDIISSAKVFVKGYTVFYLAVSSKVLLSEWCSCFSV